LPEIVTNNAIRFNRVIAKIKTCVFFSHISCLHTHRRAEHACVKIAFSVVIRKYDAVLYYYNINLLVVIRW